jgi:predicted extracellular nuclease
MSTAHPSARPVVRSLLASLLLTAVVDGTLAQDTGVTAPLVINEIMQNPAAVGDGAGEWFELYNPNPFDVDIGGWTISDDDTDSHEIAGSLLVPANGYVVLGNNTDLLTNGGATVDYSYGSSWFLANAADEVVLSDAAGNEIDRVVYDDGASFPDPTGASMALGSPDADNSDGANWCESAQAYGDGDRGTPGAENDVDCGGAPPAVVDIVINEIMQNPAAVGDADGEWFELYNAGAADVDINGWTIRDDGSDSHIINNNGVPLLVPAGGYLVLGRNADSASNGGAAVDYSYGGDYSLANGDDEVVIADATGAEVDRVAYDGGPVFPDPNGASMALEAPSLDNGVGGNWCTSTTAFGAGDLGTPGAANSCIDLPTALVINEVDADTPGTDAAEFVELYDGGAGSTPLDGLAVVFFNGSNDSSYNAFDLDGFATDANGFFVLGNPDIGVASINFGGNGLQNGADAVVLVAGDAADYPDGTPVSAVVGLVDALVYDTKDGDDAGLLALAPGLVQVNEGANGSSADDSSQRCPDGAGGALVSDGFTQALPTPGAANDCQAVPVEVTLISEIQGAGVASPLDGQAVTVEAVVVGDFQDGDAVRDLNGFFLQEEDSDADGDPLTSEGIFVFQPTTTTDVVLGDVVRVTGTVTEFFGETQIGSVQSIEVIGGGASVTPATVSLPAAATTLSQDGDYQPDLEAFEGMLVTFPETLQIVEQFQLDRFNEVKLVQGERPRQFTQVNSPNAALLDNYLRDIGARQITYDDGLSEQNANVGNLDGFGPVYGTAAAPRMGDTVTGLTGVLDYKWAGNSASGATWRVRSVVDRSVAFNTGNPRPAEPPVIDGNLTAASFNVLNFFKTLDDGSTTALGLDPRGADNADEFARQKAKLVVALAELDADVVGLVELENEFDSTLDGSTAIEELVLGLNEALGAGTYDYLYPGQQFVGSDAIAVGLIYKPSAVMPAGGTSPAILDDVAADALGFTNLPIFDGEDSNRNPLAASFEHLASGEQFTVVVNHFKSKGGNGTAANADAGDGAGSWNQRRVDAAQALAAWLETAPTGLSDDDVIILGDLNAYAQEEPVQTLISSGYTNVEDADAYSFVFDGQIGTLDYALISDGLDDGRFVGAGVWHINADEADALDYNLDFGRDPAYFDAGSAARNSDHDPLLVAFSFAAPEPPAGVTIADIIALTREGLAEETLVGTGRFRFLRGLNERSFLSRLQLAERAEGRGWERSACALMRQAFLRVDGERRPPDQLEGAAAAALATAIQQYREQNCGA